MRKDSIIMELNNIEKFQMMAQLYFDGEQSLDDVLRAFASLEMAEANNYAFWLERARFFAKGCLTEFELGNILTESQAMITNQYVYWMDKAIVNFHENPTPLKMETEMTIGDITNAFEGPRIHNEIDARDNDYEVLQSVSDEDDELMVEAEKAADAMGAASKKRLIIIISSVVGVILLLSLTLWACTGRNNEDPTYYDEFLHLSHLLEFFEDEATRDDILELNFDFDGLTTDGESIRLTAPSTAMMRALNFYFDEDDYLVRISIRNADYFNDVPATEGLVEELLEGYEVEMIDEEDSLWNFEIDEIGIVISHRNDMFSIEIGTAESRLTEKQQAIWDLIEDRLAEGYDSWAELVEWAIDNDITFDATEEGQEMSRNLRSSIDRYGLVGVYQFTEPSVGSIDDEDEVIILLTFEDLSYNEVIEDLLSLNRSSESDLSNWLANNGRNQLDRQFATVEINDLDTNGDAIGNFPSEDEAEIEFVEWTVVSFDKFTPEGEGEIVFERIYRITEIEPEEEDEDEDDEDEDPEPEVVTTLSPGTWIVGQHIPQGRFVFRGDTSGNFFIWRSGNLILNELLGGTSGLSSITTYVQNGDEIDISGINNVSFTQVTSRTPSNTLSTGNWIVGQDINAGSFYARAPLGTGLLLVWRNNNFIVNEAIGLDGAGSIPVTLQNGDIITVSGVERITFE